MQFEFFSQDIGGEHARLLEQARAGRAPDCVTVNSFQLALFIENGVLQPLDAVLQPGGDRRPLPVHPRGHHRHRTATSTPGGGAPTCASSTTTPTSSPTAPQHLGGAAGGGARGGEDRRRRRPLQRRPLGGHHLRLAGELLGAGGRARRRQRQADLRRGREPREDAEGAQLLQGPRRQRRGAEAGGDDQDLRRLQRRGDRRHGRDVLRRPLAALPAPGGDAGRGRSPSGRSPSCPARRPTSAPPAPAAGPSPPSPRTRRRSRCAPTLMREVYMGPANEVIGDLPTRQSAVRLAAEVPGPLLRQAEGVPGPRPGAAGRADLPRDLEPDPDHDGRGPVRLQGARGGARRRLGSG